MNTARARKLYGALDGVAIDDIGNQNRIITSPEIKTALIWALLLLAEALAELDELRGIDGTDEDPLGLVATIDLGGIEFEAEI